MARGVSQSVVRTGRAGGRLPASVKLKRCPGDGVFPDSGTQHNARANVYTTPNKRVQVRWRGHWQDVAEPSMDNVVVLRAGQFVTVKQTALQRGDRVVCGHHDLRAAGIRIHPQDASLAKFGFQGTHGVETPPNAMIHPYLWKLVNNYRRGRLNVWIIGPALIHLRLQPSYSRLISAGLVDVVFSNTATMTHDAESDFFGSALGACHGRGRSKMRDVDAATSHHLWAANRLRLAGGVREAVRKRILRGGLFYDLISHGIPWLAAESLRDDAPAQEVLRGADAARKAHRRIIQALVKGNALGDMTVLASQLHGIGIGNLTPELPGSSFHVVDVDPNFAMKIGNRGTTHARGFNLHLDHFLRVLLEELDGLEPAVRSELKGPRTELYERLGLYSLVDELLAQNQRAQRALSTFERRRRP